MSPLLTITPLRLCCWRGEDDGAWATACGRLFTFTDGGGPAAHGFGWCPFCGLAISVVTRSGPPVTSSVEET